VLVVLHWKKPLKIYTIDTPFRILNNRITMVCLFKWIVLGFLGRLVIIVVEFEKCSALWVWERDWKGISMVLKYLKCFKPWFERYVLTSTEQKPFIYY